MLLQWIEDVNRYIAYGSGGFIVYILGPEANGLTTLEEVARWLFSDQAILNIIDNSIMFMGMDLIYLLKITVLFLTIIFILIKAWMDFSLISCAKKDCDNRE